MVGKKLSIIEVIHLIQELKRMEADDTPKLWWKGIFCQIPKEFKITTGSVEHLRCNSEIEKILQKWG